MKRFVTLLLLSVASVLALCSCAGDVTYKDGVYNGTSEVYINEDSSSEEGNGFGAVTITIENGQITACEFTTYEPNGAVKDEDYGKADDGSVANRDYYNKAQKALAACEEYAKQLVETGSLDEVDAISGATINYNEFREAVNNALEQAAE